MSLANKLRTKQKQLKITAVSVLAQKIGVAVGGLERILTGRAAPNAATSKKYAKFLGVSVEKIQRLAPAIPRKRYTKRVGPRASKRKVKR